MAEALADAGLTTPLHLIGIPDRFIEHGSREDCLADAGLDRESLTSQIRSWWTTIAEPSPAETTRKFVDVAR